MTETVETYTYWVCVDCYVSANDPHSREELGAPAPDREPLNMIGEGEEVTTGMMWADHIDPAGCEAAFRVAAGCDCDRRDFSWTPCDGCGSTLGGSRDALTVWPART